MKITDIRVRLISNPTSKLKASISLTVDDCFAIHDIKIIEGTSGPFFRMPSRKGPDGTQRDICHATNSETRKMLQDVIMEAYNNALATPKAE